MKSLVEIDYKLRESFSKIKIGSIHGKMRAEDKRKIISDFRRNQIQILISTTIVEVGLDIPDANLMVIENPERLGLSQLHQLRGRVGRNSNQESFCILLYSSSINKAARFRLNMFKKNLEGLQIARKDLSIRGPGENLGIKQKGHPSFKIANLKRDAQLFCQVKDVARCISKKDGNLSERIIKRWKIK